jgi:hypothetical protein
LVLIEFVQGPGQFSRCATARGATSCLNFRQDPRIH